MTQYPYLMRCVDCQGNLYVADRNYRGDDVIYKRRKCGREYLFPD